MKKIVLGIFLVLGAMITSCSDFLDVEPTNSGDASTGIRTAGDARVIMNGVMRNIANVNYYGRAFPLYGDAKGGDFTIFSQGRGQDFLYVFNHAADANPYGGIWAQGYHIIAQVNNLIRSIDSLQTVGTTENFDNFKGQALTTRALVHFDLLRLYGVPYNENPEAWGVPVVTEPIGFNAREMRATVGETYAQILADLLSAQDLLPKTRTNGYINYYANKALQSRVYLYMEDYEQALSAAEEVIAAPIYALYTNDSWVDSWSREFGTESIFEAGIYPTEGDLGNTSLGAFYRRRAHGSTAILGNFLASDYFLGRLGADADDVRWGIMARDESSTTRLGSCYKYSGSIDLRGDKGANNSTAVNIKIIRLSEVYLIAAEAALLKSNADRALAVDRLNAIRLRSPNLPLATAQSITLDLIADERSKELLGEGHRFFDMMRWNRIIEFNDEFASVSTVHRPKTIDRAFYKTILPIPQDEINANPAIEAQQNPGY